MWSKPSSWKVRLASRLILRPTRHPIACSHLERHVLDAAGYRQEVYRLKQPAVVGPAQVAFLKLPGSSGRAEYSSAFPADLLAVPMEVLTWNPPGYGGSQGEARLDILCQSIPEIVDACRRELIGQDIPLIVIGTSLGAALAVYLSTVREISGMVLCNVPSLPELLLQYNQWWNLGLGGSWLASTIPTPLHTLQQVRATRTPAVMVTSLEDRVVPPALQQRIADAFAGPFRKLDIANADHDLRLGDVPRKQMTSELMWLLEQSWR